MLFQNINGLRTKLISLRQSISHSIYEIIVLVETNLSPDINNSELGFDTNYAVYRCDRSPSSSHKASGGGVLVAIRRDLVSWELYPSKRSIECVFTTIKYNNSSIFLCGVYLPPNQNSSQFVDFSSLLEELFVAHPNYNTTLVVGDFNLPNADWCDPSRGFLDLSAQTIYDVMCLLNLKQYNFIRNERGVLLDLVFSSEDVLVQNASDPLLPTECHHPALEMCIVVRPKEELYFSVYAPNIRKCDIDFVLHQIQRMNYPLLDDTSSVDSHFSEFCSLLSSTIRRASPPKFMGTRRFPIWFSPELKSLIVKKKTLHRRFKQTHDDQTYLQFCGVRAACKRLARECYSLYIQGVDCSIQGNVRAFWSYMKSSRKSPSLPSRMQLDDESADNPHDISCLFSRFFSSVFTPPSTNPPVYDFEATTSISSCKFTCEEVEAELGSLDIDKSAGPDDISPRVLRHCSSVLAPHITIYFNALVAAGIFPANLKIGYITPIFKTGSPSDIKNYRPIVIQSTLAKVFESLVLSRLVFNFKSVINVEQHGFVKGRSTTSNLLSFQSHILEAFSNSLQIDAIYTDFSKAFDRVSHTHLIAKLRAYGVGGTLLCWLESYLRDRLLQVRVAGSLSQPFPAVSGVPQGSLLGPFLFNIFINDLVQHVGSNVLLFADDAKIFKEITSIGDCESLQSSIGLLTEWCLVNDMYLNVSKCSVITFSRSSDPILYTYTLLNQPLSRCTKIKDLGVILASDLGSHEHINYITTKANSALYFIIRTGRDTFSIRALITLYIHLVRPIMEYSSTVWNPYLVGHIERLESIQNRFIRLLGLRLGFEYRDVPVHDLLLQWNLRSLHTRRKVQDLVFLKKLICSLVDAPELLEKLDFRTSRHLRHPQLFARRQFTTQYVYHSALPRLQRLANNLPEHLDVFTTSVGAWRRALKCLDL